MALCQWLTTNLFAETLWYEQPYLQWLESCATDSEVPMTASRRREAQDKVDENSGQHGNGQYRRSKSVVESTLASEPDALGAPMIDENCVDKCSQCHKCK